jgi:hypothetical protein
LDESTGTWTFSYDGTAWEHFADPWWVHKRGTSVQWTGEIVNKEDDMAGTSGNKCNFTECQYRKHGHDYQDAGIAASEVRSDDNGEWGAAWVSRTGFDIWDKNPLP